MHKENCAPQARNILLCLFVFFVVNPFSVICEQLTQFCEPRHDMDIGDVG